MFVFMPLEEIRGHFMDLDCFGRWNVIVILLTCI